MVPLQTACTKQRWVEVVASLATSPVAGQIRRGERDLLLCPSDLKDNSRHELLWMSTVKPFNLVAKIFSVFSHTDNLVSI